MPKTLEQLKPASYGPFYAAGIYPKLADIFRRHGYALAVHGSVGTDFDLIAVPWIDGVGDRDEVIREVEASFAAKFARLEPEARAHGRIVYKLAMSFGDCSLDISFTPRLAPCHVCGGTKRVRGIIEWMSEKCPECNAK